MPIRLIAMDLDKTLLRSDKTLSAFSIETLCPLHAAGIRIVIATARTEAYCEDVMRAIQPDAVISCSGALARAGTTALVDCPIPAGETDALIADILRCSSYRQMTVQTAGCHYASHPQTGSSSVPYDFTVPLHASAYKITPKLTDPADAERLRALHPACEAVRFTSEDWYRFVAKGCGKWSALQTLAEYFGILPADIAAFGDDVLDDEMLQNAGLGVAVANAFPSTAAAADCHCESNDEDGVARFLRRALPKYFA